MKSSFACLSVFVILSVHLLALIYNSKTNTSIELRFSGQILHGVHTYYSKFGET